MMIKAIVVLTLASSCALAAGSSQRCLERSAAMLIKLPIPGQFVEMVAKAKENDDKIKAFSPAYINPHNQFKLSIWIHLLDLESRPKEEADQIVMAAYEFFMKAWKVFDDIGCSENEVEQIGHLWGPIYWDDIVEHRCTFQKRFNGYFQLAKRLIDGRTIDGRVVHMERNPYL